MEAKRERATLLYYNVHSTEHYLETPPSAPPDSPAASVARPSRHIALTALAQLAVYRLHAKRCLVSLFDSKYQFVVAEATASLSLRPGSRRAPEPGDDLWLSGCAIPRRYGLCSHVLLPLEATKTTNAADDSHEDSPTRSAGYFPRKQILPDDSRRTTGISVIPDLAKDGRFSNREDVLDYPHNRFYAGTPIVTSRGIAIGVLCVLDTAPRPQGLDDAELECIADLADAVMSHLELAKLRAENRRHARMVRGIGSFVEGSSTLSGWNKYEDTTAFHGAADDEGYLDPDQQAIAMQAPTDETTGHELPTPAGSTATESSFKLPQGTDSRNQHETAVDHIFAKAANLLRECLEVEGILFINARSSSFGSMINQDSDFTDSEGSGDSEDMAPPPKQPIASGEGQDHTLFAYSTSDKSSINGSPSHGSYKVAESLLRGLMHRYPKGKTFDFDAQGLLQSSESERSAASMAGCASPDAEASTPTMRGPQKKRISLSKVNEAASLLKLLPGARSAMFLPMWDFDRERWFAGAVAWTRQTSRAFSTRGDLSFLAAFCSTIMSHVARIDALDTEKTKTALFGSISHELRSPLHGILGGIEMLADTSIDPFQGDVLHSVETCGRTLLDTMDQLLDYAKLNNFVQVANKGVVRGKAKRPRGLRSNSKEMPNIEAGMMTLGSNIEIDLIVEEVLESMYAGFGYMAAHEGGNENKDKLAVAIILDTESKSTHLGQPANRWQFYTQPGVLRRIIMNIFSNALKYTDKGHVRVSVRYLDDEARDVGFRQSGISELVIQISDTGRGMSEGYIKNHLFQAFSQEDRLVQGIGIGLSLVQRMVHTMGGLVDVNSTRTRGTSVKIRLPMTRADKASLATDRKQMAADVSTFEDDLNNTRGLRIALAGFSEATPRSSWDLEECPAGSESTSYRNDSQSWILPRQEIEDVCHSRLGMEVLPSPANAEELGTMQVRAEILMTTEASADRLVTDLIALQRPAPDSYVVPPIVVVCRSITAAKERGRCWDRSRAIVDWISQPCGPRKLAKVFALSLEKWAEAREFLSPTTKQSPSNTPLAVPPSPMQMPSPSRTMKSLIQRHTSSEEQQPAFAGAEIPPSRGAYMIAEDNPINSRILVSFMKKRGIPYDLAGDGLTALDMYKQQASKYRCILMDINMPRMDGLESSRQIRGFERTHQLPAVCIIVISALASEAVQADAFASGVDLFLTKPVRLKELGEIMDRAVGKPDSGG